MKQKISGVTRLYAISVFTSASIQPVRLCASLWTRWGWVHAATLKRILTRNLLPRSGLKTKPRTRLLPIKSHDKFTSRFVKFVFEASQTPATIQHFTARSPRQKKKKGRTDKEQGIARLRQKQEDRRARTHVLKVCLDFRSGLRFFPPQTRAVYSVARRHISSFSVGRVGGRSFFYDITYAT